MGDARQNRSTGAAHPGLREVADGVLLAVKVQPRAERNEIGPVRGDVVRIRVTAPPGDSGLPTRRWCDCWRRPWIARARGSS